MIWMLIIGCIGLGLWLLNRRVQQPPTGGTQEVEASPFDDGKNMRAAREEDRFLLSSPMHPRSPPSGTLDDQVKIHSSNVSAPKQFLKVIVNFLFNQTLPVLFITIIVQSCFNYAILFLYRDSYGIAYSGVPDMEFHARTWTCFVRSLHRERCGGL
jgi:hypothetical protein